MNVLLTEHLSFLTFCVYEVIHYMGCRSGMFHGSFFMSFVVTIVPFVFIYGFINVSDG